MDSGRFAGLRGLRGVSSNVYLSRSVFSEKIPGPPQNAMCAVRPEMCRHEHGNAADQEFFRSYCNVDHFVYLSLTSGAKVGVTRHFNIPSRWIDQGAVKALIIARVPQRVLSGKIEVAIAKHMADKTNWRKMRKVPGARETISLIVSLL